MRSQISERLAEYVRHDQPGMVTDARRVKAFLEHSCPNDLLERAVLVAAVEEGVPLRISRSSDALSIDGELDRLTTDLERDRALTPEAAYWAVRSWGWILNALPQPPDGQAQGIPGTPQQEPPLSTLPRERLAAFVRPDRQSLARDPRRIKGFLQDVCPAHRRESSVLVAAVEEGVPAEIGRVSEGLSFDRELDRLAFRLARARGLTAEAARWAVRSWAWILEVAPPPTGETPVAPPPIDPPPMDETAGTTDRPEAIPSQGSEPSRTDADDQARVNGSGGDQGASPSSDLQRPPEAPRPEAPRPPEAAQTKPWPGGAKVPLTVLGVLAGALGTHLREAAQRKPRPIHLREAAQRKPWPGGARVLLTILGVLAGLAGVIGVGLLASFSSAPEPLIDSERCCSEAGSVTVTMEDELGLAAGQVEEAIDVSIDGTYIGTLHVSTSTPTDFLEVSLSEGTHSYALNGGYIDSSGSQLPLSGSGTIEVSEYGGTAFSLVPVDGGNGQIGLKPSSGITQ